MSTYALLSIIILINKKKPNMRIPFMFIKMLPTTGTNKHIKVLKKDIKVKKTTANRHLLGLFIVLMGY